MEPESISLLSLYKHRLTNLDKTISTLYSKIATEPSVLLLQSHPLLSQYQSDRIVELVKGIIDDQREITLISCLEAYHKLKIQMENNSFNKDTQSRELLINEFENDDSLGIQKMNSRRIEINYQLDQAKGQIKRLKDELAIKTLQYIKSNEIQKLSLQPAISSLTQENRYLMEENSRLRERMRQLELGIKIKDQKTTREVEFITRQLNRTKHELQQKNIDLINAQKSLKQTQQESNFQKIHLSDKYSNLSRNKSLNSIRLYAGPVNFLPKKKFRVAQFQQLCYEMSKQQQELKHIKSNFSKFGQMLQRGIKSQLHHLRKAFIGIKSTVDSQVRQSRNQMSRFMELFEGKSAKILAQQKVSHSEKMERIKTLYEEEKILLQEKRKIEEAEGKRVINNAEVKIRDERISQLENEVRNGRQLENHYKQLQQINQQLQKKIDELIRSPKPSTSESLFSPILHVTPPPLNPSTLSHSKSLSPKTSPNILSPLSPQLKSRTNFILPKALEQSGLRIYNPQQEFEYPIKDSGARRELQNGFDELQEQIQAIIERRNKRNSRNTFRYE